MGNSLKDALKQAGFHGTVNQNERKKSKPRKEMKKSELHQEQRNFCELCENIYPDVEYYNHRNPTVNRKWLCVCCADKNEIPDETRTTNQSDFSKRKNFRRYFGSTKKF